MAFAGLAIAGMPLLFNGKLHVTVYPDRVSMASSYSQTSGREVVVPFSSLTSVELRDDRNLVRKLKTYLIFTQIDGNVIRQEAGNNERKAFDTIQQAFVEFASHSPTADANTVAQSPSSEDDDISEGRPFGSPSAPAALSAPATPAVPVAPPVSAAPNPFTSPPPIGPAPINPPAEGNAASASEQYVLKRYKITIPVPADYSIVGPDSVVVVGSKLKACFAGSWSTVTVVAVNADGTICCNWDSFPTFTYKMMRGDLTAANHNPAGAPVEPRTSQYALKRYKISIPLPDGYSVVGAETNVKVGIKLGACYAGRWCPVTVVELNEDGTITCNWDDFPTYTYKMMREDLAISRRDARAR